MNKKGVMSLFVIILLVFIVGCKKDQTGEAIAGETPYIGGNKGLIINFENFGIFNPDTNQEEIFEGESFPIELTLRNKGEFDVEPGTVNATLIGINIADFDNIPQASLSNLNLIEKVSEFNEEGGQDTIDFTPGEEDAVYKVPLISQSYDVSVFARIVYFYKTFASVPKVCFKEDLTDKTVCEVNEVKKVYSSGAPIQVQSAEEKSAGTGKIAIEFSIENVGNGRVTKPGEPFDNRFDQFSYNVSDPQDWKCTSSGKVNEGRFNIDGKAIIVCTLKNPMPEDTLYTKQLDLILSYDYKELVHKQVRIKKQ
jgi:hypothetical protein